MELTLCMTTLFKELYNNLSVGIAERSILNTVPLHTNHFGDTYLTTSNEDHIDAPKKNSQIKVSSY